MRTKLLLLSLLLLLQVALAFALGVNRSSLQAFNAQLPLLKMKQTTPDRLVFEGSAKQQLVLQKQTGDWNLPDHFGARADQAKIDQLLQSLIGLKRPWPVAESADAASRFKVAADDFERRLTFLQGDKQLDRLLLGTSPGFRKVHARVAGETTIYDIPFSTYQVSLKPEDWVDKTLLQLQPEQISAIDLADCKLVKQAGRLEVADLGAGEQTDAKQVAELLDKLAHLTILDVSAKSEQLSDEPAALSFTLHLSDGSQRSYRFISTAEGADQQLLVTDQPTLFKVSSGLQGELAAYTRKMLVQPRPAETTAAAAERSQQQ